MRCVSHIFLRVPSTEYRIVLVLGLVTMLLPTLSLVVGVVEGSAFLVKSVKL